MSKKTVKQNIQDKKNLKSEYRDYFKNDWFNLLILFFVCLLLFRDLLTGSAWLHDDFPYVYYPGKFLASVSLSNGVFPFWNPYSFGGMPFFADPQIAILYPVNFLLQFFVSNSYLDPLIVQISIVIHYFLISIFSYYLGKEFKFDNFASLAFSIMFTYSSYMIIHMIHMNLIETVVWLPLLFLLILKFVNKKKYIYIIIAGVIMAISILAGYPQSFFYNYIFLAVFLLYKVFLSVRNKDYGSVRIISTGCIIFFVVSICISSVQLLPTYVLSENSSRIETGYEFAKQGSVHPMDIITLFVPKIFGTFNWNKSAEEVSYWSVKSNGGHQEGSYMYTVSTLYLTLLPLIILIPVILFSFKKKQLFFPMIFFLSVSFIVILFSFGGNFFLHQLFYYFVPFFNRFRNPGHITYLFSFSILLVSAFGINGILKNRTELKKYFSLKYFLILASILILVFLSANSGLFKANDGPSSSPQINSWITKQINIFVFLSFAYLAVLYFYFTDKLNIGLFRIILLVILVIDIYIFAFNQNNGDTDPAVLYSQNSNLINQVKEDQKDELFRVNMRDGRNMLFQRYQGAVDRIQLLEGINVLNLNRVFPVNKEGNSKQLLDLMNVKYKIKVDDKSKSMSMAMNESYLPRAKMFYDVKVFTDESLLKNYMKSNEYDYKKTLVIEKTPINMALPKPDTSSEINSSVKVTYYEMNRIKMEVITDENGFLFLSEIYYPDWKAFVDEKEAEIYRADYSLRAVYLEKGKHMVEFIYESREFNIGSKVSLVAFSITLLLIGIFYFKDKRTSGKS